MKEGQKYIAVEGQAKTWEEAIELCGETLLKNGYVEEGFSSACIEREKEFPTGLCSEIPVAIPHCKSDAIKKNGVCYLRLKEPVVFHRMDDDEETISTRNIFNIAIKGTEDHLEFLQQMMGVVMNKELLLHIEELNIEKVPELLENHFLSNLE